MKTLPAEITAELAKDIMHIKHLFTISLVSATYRWTEGRDNIYYGGYWYEARGLSFEQASITLASQVDSLTLNIANVNKSFSDIVLAEDIRGRSVTIRRVFLDNNLAIIGTPTTIFVGYIDNMEIDRKRAKIEIYNHMIKWKTMTPKRMHSPTCPWKFKSTECGYTGIDIRNAVSDYLAEWTRSVGSLNYANIDDYLNDLTIGGTFTGDADDSVNHIAHAFDDDAATYWKSMYHGIITVTLNNGGIDYSVNDVLTIIQGAGFDGTVTVTSVAGGVVDGISLTTAGNDYSVANGLSTTVVPAGGTGCLINITVINPAELPHWTCCQFAAAKTINRYAVTPVSSTRAPTIFTLQGSTDGLTWTTIDERYTESWPTTPLRRVFDIKLPGSYVYCRLFVLGCSGNLNVEVEELELIGAATEVNDLDYNYTTNVATKADLFGHSGVILASDAVVASAMLRVRAKQTVAAARNLGARLKIGGNTYDHATPVAPTDSYANYDFSWALNPLTGLAWTYLDFSPPPDQCDGVNTRDVLLHLDGYNDSTILIDEYGHEWIVNGNAKLNTADKKWGTASLELDGAGDYIDNTTITSLSNQFTIEGWFHTDNINTTYQGIVSAVNASLFGLLLAYNRDGDKKMTLFLSSDGATWDIATDTNKGTKVDWVNGTWYKWVVDYDGATYRVYFGTSGALTLDISTASASVICAITKTWFGAYSNTYFLDGGLDEIKMTIRRSQYGAAASAETATFSVEKPIYADSFSSTSYPSNAIDDKPTTYWHVATALPHWICYLLSSAKIIKQYSILPNSSYLTRAPKDFKLQGSNTGLTWTDLDTRVDETGWVAGVKRYFGLANTTVYLYCRLYITSNDGGTANNIMIDEWELQEATHIEKIGYYVPADAGGNRVDVSQCYLKVTSDVTWCDYTHDRCEELNNLLNYGGFKYMPEIATKEFWWGTKQRVWTGG